MFADEARFGRMNRPRPCWAPPSVRPAVASQLIREFNYLYGAVSPMDGACAFLILPAADTECFQIFLDTMRIPTKPATFSDLKAAICSDVKPDAVPRRSRPKIPIGMSDAGAAPAGRWG